MARWLSRFNPSGGKSPLSGSLSRRSGRRGDRSQNFDVVCLGRLAAGVSHEIRNPLGVVFLQVDLLEEELRQPSSASETAIAEALAEIKTNLARLDTPRPGGTGLQLYIVQGVLAAHGGRVSVQITGGSGTTFTITLPLAGT